MLTEERICVVRFTLRRRSLEMTNEKGGREGWFDGFWFYFLMIGLEPPFSSLRITPSEMIMRRVDSVLLMVLAPPNSASP